MGEVLGGTETFGAPECHPTRRRTSTAVHQTIDIWSLACVFSIAATWVALGYQGILQYAEVRKNAIRDNKRQNPAQLDADTSDDNDNSAEKKSTEDCFHNGHDVLPEVTEWHKFLRVILRRTDTLTSLVLDLIDNQMLLSDPTKRLSATETCIQLDKIYKEAEEAPTKLDNKIPEMITEALRQLDDSAPAKALPKTPSEESSPDLHSRTAKSKRLEVPLMKTTHRSEVFKPVPRQISQSLEEIQQSEPPKHLTGRQDSGTEQESSTEQDFGLQRTGIQHTPRTSPGYPSPVYVGTSVRQSTAASLSSTSPQHVTSAHKQTDDANHPAARWDDQSMYSPSTAMHPAARPYSLATTSGPSMYEMPPRRSPAPPSTNSSSPSKPRTPQQDTPRQDVVEARRQLDQGSKGMRGMARKLFGKQKKDTILSSHFHNRDLLFLVDNGATMKEFWGQATLLLETLVMKAVGQDPDGPDLKFTMGKLGLEGIKSSSAFKAAMEDPDAMPTGEVTDIKTSFGKIFDEYLKKLEISKRTHETVKQLTIIVLTDGVWPGTLVKQEVDQQIVTFVRRVKELTNNVIPRHVSIEFIQFGRDPEATNHLMILDDLLKAPGVQSVYFISLIGSILTAISETSLIPNLLMAMYTRCS